jgi:hypothetical protein
MKKYLKTLLIALPLMLTACSDDMTPEDVTHGIKRTYQDIVDIQAIPLQMPEGGSRPNCPDMMNTGWVIFRTQANETYLSFVGTNEGKQKKFSICYKQKLF